MPSFADLPFDIREDIINSALTALRDQSNLDGLVSTRACYLEEPSTSSQNIRGTPDDHMHESVQLSFDLNTVLDIVGRRMGSPLPHNVRLRIIAWTHYKGKIGKPEVLYRRPNNNICRCWLCAKVQLPTDWLLSSQILPPRPKEPRFAWAEERAAEWIIGLPEAGTAVSEAAQRPMRRYCQELEGPVLRDFPMSYTARLLGLMDRMKNFIRAEDMGCASPTDIDG